MSRASSYQTLTQSVILGGGTEDIERPQNHGQRPIRISIVGPAVS